MSVVGLGLNVAVRALTLLLDFLIIEITNDPTLLMGDPKYRAYVKVGNSIPGRPGG